MATKTENYGRNKSNKRWILFDFLVGKMPILRGLMPLKINDYRKCRKIKENRKTPTQNGNLLNIKQNASFIQNDVPNIYVGKIESDE